MPDADVPNPVAKRNVRHLRRRVREEAEAAVNAAGLSATLAHLALATAYARRLRDRTPQAAASTVRPAPYLVTD